MSRLPSKYACSSYLSVFKENNQHDCFCVHFVVVALCGLKEMILTEICRESSLIRTDKAI